MGSKSSTKYHRLKSNTIFELVLKMWELSEQPCTFIPVGKTDKDIQKADSKTQ